VKRYETLGLIGESGCGKSTLARSILRLIEPTSGNILFYSNNLLSLSPKETIKFRQNMQIVLKGQVPSLINPPSGCRFHPRCSFYSKICSDKRPEIKQVKDGHSVACHNE